jgi:hypothetical protein
LLEIDNLVIDDLERFRTLGENCILELGFELWPAEQCASDVVDAVGSEGRLEAVSIEDGDSHQAKELVDDARCRWPIAAISEHALLGEVDIVVGR